jgi:hypothetical protein
MFLLLEKESKSGLFGGNALNPTTNQEIMQRTQEMLDLFQDDIARTAAAKKMLELYLWRTGHYGPQPLEGEGGTEDWLKALEILTLSEGRLKGEDEVRAVVTTLQAWAESEENARLGDAAATEAWWLNDRGRRLISEVLVIPSLAPTRMEGDGL